MQSDSFLHRWANSISSDVQIMEQRLLMDYPTAEATVYQLTTNPFNVYLASQWATKDP